MDDQSIYELMNKELGLEIEHSKDPGYYRLLLADKINDWLNSDFQKLISILYRLDVDENRLKAFLRENPDTDAGLIIADLIIERQIAKIKSRRESTKRDENFNDEERW